MKFFDEKFIRGCEEVAKHYKISLQTQTEQSKTTQRPRLQQ